MRASQLSQDLVATPSGIYINFQVWRSPQVGCLKHSGHWLPAQAITTNRVHSWLHLEYKRPDMQQWWCGSAHWTISSCVSNGNPPETTEADCRYIRGVIRLISASSWQGIRTSMEGSTILRRTGTPDLIRTVLGMSRFSTSIRACLVWAMRVAVWAVVEL